MQNKQTHDSPLTADAGSQWLNVGSSTVSRPPCVPPGDKERPTETCLSPTLALVGSSQPRWLLLTLPWSNCIPPLFSYCTSCCFSEWSDWWIIQQSSCKLLCFINVTTAEEMVQSISRGSCLLGTCSPGPQSTANMQEGTQICSASPKYPCDRNTYTTGLICCVCLGDEHILAAWPCQVI